MGVMGVGDPTNSVLRSIEPWVLTSSIASTVRCKVFVCCMHVVSFLVTVVMGGCVSMEVTA